MLTRKLKKVKLLIKYNKVSSLIIINKYFFKFNHSRLKWKNLTVNVPPSFLEIETKVKFVNAKESKFPIYNLNLIQSSIKADSFTKLDKGFFILAEQTNNRLIRFIWAMLIVIVSSFGCFIFIKSSVDWVIKQNLII